MVHVIFSFWKRIYKGCSLSEMMKGRIFIVSGVSAAGKTALVDVVLKRRPNTIRAISYTTRKPRLEEVDGRDYFFVEKRVFLRMVESGDFLEWSEVYGNLYGTGLDSFKSIEEGKGVVKIMDVRGALKIKRAGIKAVFIFLKVKKATIRKRLRKRQESDIEERTKAVDEELKAEGGFDHVLVTEGDEGMIEKNAEKLIRVMDDLH